MAKVTENITVLFNKSFILKLFKLRNKQPYGTPIAFTKEDKHADNNAERRSHVYPETGICYWSATIVEFELHRARIKVLI